MSDPTPPTEPQPPAVVQARPITSAPPAFAARPGRLPLPIELPGLPLRAAALDLALIALAAMLVPFGFQIVTAVLSQAAYDWDVGDLTADDLDLLIIQTWFQVLLGGGLLTYVVLRNRLSPACFGLRFNRLLGQLVWTIGSLAASYAWMLASLLMIGFLVLLFPALEEDLMNRSDMIELLPVNNLARTIMLMIPVALHEETIFRGLLLPYLRRLTGRWWCAVLISSCVFAALHFNQGLLGALQILGIGTIFGILFVLSRSLIAVTVAHFVFNVLQVQLMRLVQEFDLGNF